MKRESSRLEYLDTIRGLAALTVVIYHFIVAYGTPWRWLRVWPVTTIWDGRAAVSVFFVLSGIVLSLRHFDGTDRWASFDYGRYAISRVCRIWIPYAFAVIVCAVAFPILASHQRTNPPPTQFTTSLWNVRPSFSLIRHDLDLLYPRVPTTIPPGWTLADELILSFLVPAGILLTKRNPGWLIFCAALLARVTGMAAFPLHFATGILIAKYRFAITRHISRFWPVPLLLGLLLYGIRPILEAKIPDELIWCITGAGAALILCVALSSDLLQRHMSYRGLVSYVGLTSYGVYLWHMAILVCVTPRFLFLNDPIANWCIGLTATVIISIGVSIPFYRFVEVPAIRLGKLRRGP